MQNLIKIVLTVNIRKESRRGRTQIAAVLPAAEMLLPDEISILARTPAS